MERSFLFADRKSSGEDAVLRGDGQEDTGCLYFGNEQGNSPATVLVADGKHLCAGTARWNRLLLLQLLCA